MTELPEDFEQLEEIFNQGRKARPKMTKEQIEAARAEMDELDRIEDLWTCSEGDDMEDPGVSKEELKALDEYFERYQKTHRLYEQLIDIEDDHSRGEMLIRLLNSLREDNG